MLPGKKLAALLLAMAMVVTIMPVLGTATGGRIGVQTVYAAEDDPASVQDRYDIDGVTYVNTGDKTFNTNQTAYYKAMLGNALNSKVAGMSEYSISDLWMQMAWYMEYYNNNSEHAKDLFKRWNRLYEPREYSEHPDYWEPRQQAIMNLLLARDTGDIQYDTFPFKWGDDEFNALWFRDTLRSAANSTAMAEDVARTAASMEKAWGEDARVSTVEIKDAPEESGLVFYRTLGTVNTEEDHYKEYDAWSEDQGHAAHMVVVAFSDFTVTPIIPAENDTEPYVFVKSTNGSTDSSVNRPMVSDVKNASTQPATVSQSISESTSQTLTSSISGSSSHAVAQTHKTGIKFQPRFGGSAETRGLGIEIMYEYNKTVTDTVTKGWSKGESVTNTDSKTNSVSVTLPPYTAILLNQKRSSGESTYRYNCPVALNFKATVYYVSEDVRGSTYSCVHFRKLAEFGGEEIAMADLSERYNQYKIASTADKDGIRWIDMSKHCDAAINLASTTATFDSTDATFTNLTEVVKTEIDSILPILPIKYIRPVNVNDESTLTNQPWDFDIDMNEGDSGFISKIKLKALNDVGAEFATFNQAKGHYIVVDKNGKEDTSGSIVELVKVNGQNKYVAKGEGTAYLKYIINEDEYQTAAMAAAIPSDRHITNKDIENSGGSTAVIEVHVHHKHNLTRHAAKDPTCTKDGNIAYWKCSKDSCGKLFSDKYGENEIFADETVVKKTGHKWGEWEVTLEPTETKEGVKIRECLGGCDETQTKSIPVTSHVHKLVRHAPKAATCTKDGNIAYWSCSEGDNPCGKLFSDKNGEDEISEDETVTFATGHSWGEWKTTVAPTETTEGEETSRCMNRCGKKKTRAVPVLPHNPTTEVKASNIFAKVSASRKSQRLSWTKVKGADGYSVYFTPCASNDTVGNYDLVRNVNSKTYSFTQKGLKKGREYKYYVEAYKNVNGKRVVIARSLSVHSIAGNYNKKYTNPKKVTTGKTQITVKKGTTYKIKGNKIKTYKKGRRVLNHEATYRYRSSNTRIATVSSKGMIKGESKGACSVHVIANNGVETIIKVTVK